MLEINITKIGTYDPPEIGIWKNHDFQNEFQIRVRNKKDESYCASSSMAATV